MRCLVVWIFVALSFGCTTRYAVARDDLEEARRREQPALPARAMDGRPTWLALDSIEDERHLSASTVEVGARDTARGMRNTGWVLVGTGPLLAAAGANMVYGDHPPTADLSEALGRVFLGFGFLGLGAISTVTGGGLLVAGYVSDGPEVPPPPAANATAPARR